MGIFFRKGITRQQKIEGLIIYLILFLFFFSIYRAWDLKRIFIPNREFEIATVVVFLFISLFFCSRWLYQQIKLRCLLLPKPTKNLKFYGRIIWGTFFRFLCWSGIAILLSVLFTKTLGWLAYEISSDNTTFYLKIAAKKHDKFTTRGECTYRVSFYLKTKEKPTKTTCVSQEFFLNYKVGDNIKLQGTMSFAGINIISEL